MLPPSGSSKILQQMRIVGNSCTTQIPEATHPAARLDSRPQESAKAHNADEPAKAAGLETWAEEDPEVILYSRLSVEVARVLNAP
jgi:hypothetical protein